MRADAIDALVLDPPYMEGLLRPKAETRGGLGSHVALRDFYASGGAHAAPGGGRWHQAVLDLYLDAGREARRVLRDHGILIVKCQDEVSANRQELTHVQLVIGLAALGFYARDLFVLVRTGRPGIARLLRQVHARKNHSYFLVFQKVPAGQEVARYRTRDLPPRPPPAAERPHPARASASRRSGLDSRARGPRRPRRSHPCPTASPCPRTASRSCCWKGFPTAPSSCCPAPATRASPA